MHNQPIVSNDQQSPQTAAVPRPTRQMSDPSPLPLIAETTKKITKKFIKCGQSFVSLKKNPPNDTGF